MVKHSKRQGGQRIAINTKVTEEIRSRLEAAAEDRKHTLSAEIEYRLVRSFLDDKAYEFEDEMLKDEATKDLLSKLQAILGTIYRYTGRSWKDDQPSRDAVASAVGVALQLSFMNEPIEPPALGSEDRKVWDRQRMILRAQGKMMALAILAPYLKDKGFQEFVDAQRNLSGFVEPEPDADYEEIRRQLEILSEPKDKKGKK